MVLNKRNYGNKLSQGKKLAGLFYFGEKIIVNFIFSKKI